MSDISQIVDQPDLTNCDREPIHIPGRIQSFGALLAFTSDWLVSRMSDNAPDFLNLSSGDPIGQDIGELFPDDVVHRIRGRLQMLGHTDAVERIFAVDLHEDGHLFDLAIHLSGSSILLEAERHSGRSDNDYIGYVRPMIERIRATQSIETLCDVTARQIRLLTGFDRVMVYQFREDGAGDVIAEAKSSRMTPFKGLRYPASDIPKQARALYKRNLLRIISDVNDEGVPIHPVLDGRGEPLDLSLSTTRAVSPIHLEYLRNMGVGASMSISIIVQGELWGLIACHHNSPRILSLELRSAAELFAQFFGFVMSEAQSNIIRENDLHARLLHDRIMAELADGRTIADNFDTFARTIKSAIPYTGIVAWTDGHFQSQGRTPTREQFMAIARFLNTNAASQVYSTHHLSQHFPPAEDYADVGAGILALPVSRRPRDYIVLFREAAVRNVSWGGNPDKPVEPGPNGIRLTPRKSFEAWQQTVRDQSEPWTEQERRAADSLRVTLLEVVLRMTDAANQERTRSQEQQELLIAELNHRVRNILNLIRGLINQSSASQSVSEFTKVIGGRIHALARAHDQITQENWQPASAFDLIETEANAYLGDARDRVTITGQDAMLTPTAFTTLSLVIHEMMTNAVKYGALSNENGTIDIRLAESHGGAFAINWLESGGPPVQPPTRKGFGTTITERSIEYDLNGESRVNYNVAGVSAHFMIPAASVASFQTIDRSDEGPTNAEEAVTAKLSGHILIVEDNMIIAMDAQDMIYHLGADQISVVSGVAEALDLIESDPPDFAILDINLGVETSERIARRLSDANLPFAFATGYGERTALAERFPDVPVLRKPYDREALARLFA